MEVQGAGAAGARGWSGESTSASWAVISTLLARLKIIVVLLRYEPIGPLICRDCLSRQLDARLLPHRLRLPGISTQLLSHFYITCLPSSLPISRLPTLSFSLSSFLTYGVAIRVTVIEAASGREALIYQSSCTPPSNFPLFSTILLDIPCTLLSSFSRFWASSP